MSKQKKINMTKANLNKLKWPTDKWGCCKELKEALLSSIARCAGHPDKMKVLEAVLKEANLHKEAKDAEATKLKKEKAEAIKAAKEAEDKAIKEQAINDAKEAKEAAEQAAKDAEAKIEALTEVDAE